MASSKKASKAPPPRHSRLRRLVPVIEHLSPELRDLVVNQIDSLVNLVVLLEKYTKRELAPKPKAPQRAGRPPGRHGR